MAESATDSIRCPYAYGETVHAESFKCGYTVPNAEHKRMILHYCVTLTEQQVTIVLQNPRGKFGFNSKQNSSFNALPSFNFLNIEAIFSVDNVTVVNYLATAEITSAFAGYDNAVIDTFLLFWSFLVEGTYWQNMS